MKIRTSLRIISTVSLLTLGALLVSTVLSVNRLRRAGAFESFLIEFQRDQVERVMLRDDFLLSGRPAAFLQWQQKSEEVEGHLEELSGMPVKPYDRALIGRMKRNFRATKAILPRISDLRRAAEGGESTGSKPLTLERRLINQLFVNAYLLSDSVGLLLQEARNDTILARNRLLLLLGLFTVALALTVIGTSVYLNRLLSRGIADLKTGTDLFSEGRLDHRIPAVGNDELADLARQFNGMADRLKHSYTSLEDANRELEGFSYSVSHDLRTPLRHVLSFSELLRRQNPEGLDDKSRHYLDVICTGATQLGRLIDDLLAYSRMGRGEMLKKPVQLDAVVSAVVRDLKAETAGRSVKWIISPLPTVFGDESMLRLVMGNLLSNALKFTARVPEAVIEVGSRGDGEEVLVFVRDNGTGFDMKYADKLFGLFQRLHHSDEFAGTGVGLANVQRIIHRHGGRAWGEGKVGGGAAFFFSLPKT